MANEIQVWGDGRVGLWSFDQGVDIPEDFEEIPRGPVPDAEKVDTVFKRWRRGVTPSNDE